MKTMQIIKIPVLVELNESSVLATEYVLNLARKLET